MSIVEFGSVEKLVMPTTEDCHRQVQRILQSVTFRTALTLQQLLQFITVRALTGDSPEPIKEYTIGVEAFGRPHDFDPKTDTIVRVQIHRLKQKLKEYYESEGRGDPILVEISKGNYLPRFESKSATQGDSDVEQINQKESMTQQAGVSPRAGEGGMDSRDGRVSAGRRPLFVRVLVGAGALIAVFALGLLIGINKKNIGGEAQGSSALDFATSADPVKAFWARFIGDDPTPIIVYSDTVFFRDSANDLFSLRRGAIDDQGAVVDPHLARESASNPTLISETGVLYYEHGYTGIGELRGLATLAGLFGQMGIQPIIKSSRDVTSDDLRQHSVILLGSSFQNVAVAQFMTHRDFTYRNSGSNTDNDEIINANPQAQEDAIYRAERDVGTHVLRTDYGIVTIQAGLAPHRHIAILGGISTAGTEGATIFLTSKNGVERIQKTLGLPSGPGRTAEIPQFQALIHVRLEKGRDVADTSLVTIHQIPSTDTPSPERGTTLHQPK